MRLPITFTIFLSSLTIMGQEFDTEFKYTDSAGKDVIIQNSYPVGGGNIDGVRDIDAVRGYYDSTGTYYGYGVFWTRIINETTSPLELTINFPADSLTISPSSDNYFKLFLPPDTMTVDKLSLYNYGITGLKSFLDTHFNTPTVLQRTINPNEEFMFYIALLLHVPDQRDVIRAGVVIEEQDLFYRISIDPFGPETIPSGQIVFKKSKQ